MVEIDLSAVRSQLARLSLGQLTPEFLEQMYGVVDIQEMLQGLAPAVEALIKELLTEIGGIEDPEESDQAAQVMLRELATTAFVAGVLFGGIPPSGQGLTIDITPETAAEIVRALFVDQSFRLSFEVKE
jgi:hypothetical protein